ncbi:MAG: hypothetical protein WAL71_08085 [Terriglobales bacterium]|jgi:hypothetical protein
MLRPFLVLWLLNLSTLVVCSQAPSNETDGAGSASASAQPVVIFTLDFPESEPAHYAIHIPSAGEAHYESIGNTVDSGVPDSFDFGFTISNETRSRIFALAAKAGYFETDVDAHRKNIAFTGKKILRYTDANRTAEAVFNYSSNPAVQELTTLFQNLSTTLEFGHRLDYDRRYQKLALNDELKRMQEMGDSRMLAEVKAIQPILEKIVADQSVVNVARARAQRLLKDSEGQ